MKSPKQKLLDSLAPLEQRNPKLEMQLRVLRAAHQAIEACCAGNVLWVSDPESHKQLHQLKRTPKDLAQTCLERWKPARITLRKLPVELLPRVLGAPSEDRDLPEASMLRIRMMRKLFRDYVSGKAPAAPALVGELAEIFAKDKGSYPALFAYFEHADEVLTQRIRELERRARGEKPRAHAATKLDPNFDFRRLAAKAFRLLVLLAKNPQGLTMKELSSTLKYKYDTSVSNLVIRLKDKYGIEIENHHNQNGYILKDEALRERILKAATPADLAAADAVTTSA